jgi:hypothetical protein
LISSSIVSLQIEAWLVLHVVSILILMTNTKAGVSHFGDQHPGLDHSMLRDSPSSVMTSNDSSIMKIVTIDGLHFAETLTHPVTLYLSPLRTMANVRAFTVSLWRLGFDLPTHKLINMQNICTLGDLTGFPLFPEIQN